MKQLLLAAALSAVGVANAAGLSFVNNQGTGTLTHAFDPAPNVGLPSFFASQTFPLGTLTTDIAGTITFTFLGKEAGYLNEVDLIVGVGPAPMNNTSPVGSSVNAMIGTGVVNFSFSDPNGSTINGGTWTNTSIGLITSNFTTNLLQGSLPAGSNFQYVLGFNDSFTNHDDWDDFVIGVNFAPVPEPGTYALMFAGLAAVGFVARRRRQS